MFASPAVPSCPVAPVFLFFGQGFPFKVNQPKKDALFSSMATGHLRVSIPQKPRGTHGGTTWLSILESSTHSLSSWTLYFWGRPFRWERLDFLGQREVSSGLSRHRLGKAEISFGKLLREGSCEQCGEPSSDGENSGDSPWLVLRGGPREQFHGS